MADPMGEADRSALWLGFDRRLMLQFRGSTITSDAGLLAYRELDDALHLTDTGANRLVDARTGKNGRHRLAGLLRNRCSGGWPATRMNRKAAPTMAMCGRPPRCKEKMEDQQLGQMRSCVRPRKMRYACPGAMMNSADRVPI